MGSFKETKRNAIETGKEKGDLGIAKGEQRVQELQSIKSLIDSIEIEDDEDASMVESLNDSYLEAGKAAHQEEVQAVVDAANRDLSSNKSEINSERRKVENAESQVKEMQNVTDLAKNAAHGVEEALKNSASDYGDMERQTDLIETELQSNSQDILNRIEGIF